MFPSISTPKDFDVDTWFTGVPLIFRTRDRVLSRADLSLSRIKFEFVCDQPFADILQIFIQTGLKDSHILISVVIKMRITAYILG